MPRKENKMTDSSVEIALDVVNNQEWPNPADDLITLDLANVGAEWTVS